MEKYVYTIAKCGIFAHFVPGAWQTYDEAALYAHKLAEQEADGYHDWQIHQNWFDGETSLIATVGRHPRSAWKLVGVEYQRTEPPPVVGWWAGKRTDDPPTPFGFPEIAATP